jgi:hypothetical protein
MFSAWIASVVKFLRDRRRHIAVAVGAVLAILIAAWWSGPPRGAPTHPTLDPVGAAARTHPVQTPLTALLWPRSPQPTAKDDELCGYGPVPRVNGIPQFPPGIEAAGQSALVSIASDLATRTTDRERALGLYLQTYAVWLNGNRDCDSYDLPCQATRSAAAESRRALVRLATTSSDADAYALATVSCAATGEPSSDECALLSSAQWARIEPDNLVPWLYLAGDAQRLHDRSALEAALHRASKARYSDSHLEQISQFLASDLVAAQSPPVQFQLAFLLLGVEPAFHPDYQVLTQYCSVAAQTDPNRVQTCTDLAETLVDHSRTAVEVVTGAKLAEPTSSDPRRSALIDKADAIRWQWWQWLKSQPQDVPISCESLQVLHRRLASEVQLGESGRLRQELAAGGLTTSEAAQQYRAERQRLVQLGETQKSTQKAPSEGSPLGNPHGSLGLDREDRLR